MIDQECMMLVAVEAEALLTAIHGVSPEMQQMINGSTSTLILAVIYDHLECVYACVDVYVCDNDAK